MDLPLKNLEGMDQHNIDLEKGQLNLYAEPPSISAPSPTATSSTAISTIQSSETIRKGGFRQLVDKLIYFFRWSKPNEREEQPDEQEEPDDIPGVITRTLEECPAGYPRVAAFLDSDENFMLYRRFGYLQSRILLHKQDELRALEEKLDIIDQSDDADPDKRKLLKSRDLDDKSSSPRKALLEIIETKFREYAEFLNIAQTLVALNKPSTRDYNSVLNHFENNSPCPEDECYIYRKEDIITLKPGRENAWLDGIIEKGLQKFTCPPIRYLFRSAETRAKTTGNTVYYTKSRIDTLVTLVITFIIVVLLIIPVYLLWHLSLSSPTGPNTPMTIGILMVFTLIFSAVLSFFTRASKHEIFGAAAAYCAVLVVFIGNVGQGMSSLAYQG